MGGLLWRSLRSALLGSLFAVTSETACEVLSGHVAVSLMRSRTSCTHLEVRVEQVRAVATAWHAIVDDQLDNDFEGSLLTVGNILAAVSLDLSELGETTAHACAIRAVMANQAFRASIISVELCSLSKSIAPTYGANRLDIVQEIDSLLDSCGALVSRHRDLSWSL